MNQEELLAKMDTFVYHYLREYLPVERVFHDYDHAREVAEVALELSEKAELSSDERFCLVTAGWFHDTGYVKGEEGHEGRSATLADEFLRKHDVSEKQIATVRQLILSTHPDQTPQSLLESLLHDANYAFLGRKRFERRANLLRLEEEYIHGTAYTLLEWQQYLLDLQMKTRFYSRQAYELFSKRQNKNMAALKEDLRKGQKQAIRKKTGKDFGRGVDTVYRVTLRNHINLSSIADGKANMIISINTLVLSILITASSAGFSLTELELASNLKFVLPVLTLMLSSLSAIIFAVLSAIPKVSGQSFSPEDVKKHRVSLLYFGNFLKLQKEDFVDYLRDLKKDQEILYDDLSRDLYNLGAVLDKKYRMLSIAYRIFVGGLALSFVVFLVTFFVV